MIVENDVVVVKLSNGEMLTATYKGQGDSGLGFPSISLTDIAIVQMGRSKQDPSKFTYSLVPWQAELMHIASDKIIAIGTPNEMARGEYQRTFHRILTPTINDMAAMPMSAHGKL